MRYSNHPTTHTTFEAVLEQTPESKNSLPPARFVSFVSTPTPTGASSCLYSMVCKDPCGASSLRSSDISEFARRRGAWPWPQPLVWEAYCSLEPIKPKDP